MVWRLFDELFDFPPILSTAEELNPNHLVKVKEAINSSGLANIPVVDGLALILKNLPQLRCIKSGGLATLVGLQQEKSRDETGLRPLSLMAEPIEIFLRGLDFYSSKLLSRQASQGRTDTSTRITADARLVVCQKCGTTFKIQIGDSMTKPRICTNCSTLHVYVDDKTWKQMEWHRLGLGVQGSERTQELERLRGDLASANTRLGTTQEELRRLHEEVAVLKGRRHSERPSMSSKSVH